MNKIANKGHVTKKTEIRKENVKKAQQSGAHHGTDDERKNAKGAQYTAYVQLSDACVLLQGLRERDGRLVPDPVLCKAPSPLKRRGTWTRPMSQNRCAPTYRAMRRVRIFF